MATCGISREKCLGLEDSAARHLAEMCGVNVGTDKVATCAAITNPRRHNAHALYASWDSLVHDMAEVVVSLKTAQFKWDNSNPKVKKMWEFFQNPPDKPTSLPQIANLRNKMKHVVNEAMTTLASRRAADSPIALPKTAAPAADSLQQPTTYSCNLTNAPPEVAAWLAMEDGWFEKQLLCTVAGADSTHFTPGDKVGSQGQHRQVVFVRDRFIAIASHRKKKMTGQAV
jgi:hypothetical protein